MSKKHILFGFLVVAVASFSIGYGAASSLHNRKHDQRIAENAIHAARNKADILNQMLRYSMKDGLHSLQNSLLLDVSTLLWVLDDSKVPQRTKNDALSVLKQVTSPDSDLFRDNHSKYLSILPKVTELLNGGHNKASDAIGAEAAPQHQR